jgi:hypothetical protein
MVKTIGYGLSGSAWYYVEDTYGEGIPSSEVTLSLSDYIDDVRIETGDVHTPVRGIGDVSVASFMHNPEDETLHVEYKLQYGDTLVKDSIYRNLGTCDLQSLAFVIGTSTCSDEVSYFVPKGVKCKSLTISGSRGEAWQVSADYSVRSTVTYSALAGAGGIYSSGASPAPASRATDICTFNKGGSITIGGSPIAFITDSFEVTIENNLADYWDVGSELKRWSMPGALNITGSCDISLDAGGAEMWGRIKDSANRNRGNIIINFGNGCKMTLSGVRFNTGSIDVNTSGEGMMSSVPFTASSVTLTGTGWS